MAKYSTLSDQELTVLLREGDRDAFQQIYRKYWQDLYNTAYQRSRDRALSQDIVQNVFTDLWIRKNVAHIQTLAGYLHQAIRFQVLKQASRKPLNSILLDSFEEIISSSIRTDDPLLEKEIVNIIGLWIGALPEKRRKIFILHYQEELSTNEIARRLGISQKTVQNQLSIISKEFQIRIAHFFSLSLLLAILLK